MVTGIAGTLFQSASIGLLLYSAWGINLACAAIAGASISLMLQRIGIDPALAGGALLTIVTDVIWLYGVLRSGNPVFDVTSKAVARLKL